MRRASVLVAVTAVSVVIMSACTSFPELTLEDGLTGEDGSVGGDDDGSVSGGDGAGDVTGDGSSSGGGDGSTAGKDAASGTDAAAAKDSTPPADATKADTGPDPCTTYPLDCSMPANKACSACTSACLNPQGMDACGMSTPSCCVLGEMGQSGKYMSCCYSATGSLFPPVAAGSCTSSCMK